MLKRRKKSFLALILSLAIALTYMPNVKNIVCAETNNVLVEYIDYNGSERCNGYESLAEALEFVNSKDGQEKLAKETKFKITLYSDIEVSEKEELEMCSEAELYLDVYKLTITGSLKVDGNITHTEKSTTNMLFVNTGGKLEVSGGTTDNVDVAGTINVNGGKVTNVKMTTSDSTCNVKSGTVGTLNVEAGTCNVDGGKVNTISIGSGICNISDGEVATVNANGGTTQINGGKVEAVNIDGGVCDVNGGNVADVSIENGDCNVYGGEVEAISIDKEGKCNIEDGIIATISMKDGVLSVGNCEITGYIEVSGGSLEISEYNIVAIKEIRIGEEQKGKVLLGGGYFGTDPSILVDKYPDIVSFNEDFDVECYEDLSEADKESWPEDIDPKKYGYRVVNTFDDADFMVTYSIGDTSYTKYYRSLGTMTAGLDKIAGNAKIAEPGFKITFMEFIEVGEDEAYYVETDTDVSIDLDGYCLTLYGDLVFGDDCPEISSVKESGNMTFYGQFNKSFSLISEDTLDIYGGEYDTITNLGAELLYLDECKVNNLVSANVGKTGLIDVTVGVLRIADDSQAYIDGDTLVTELVFGNEGKAVKAEDKFELSLYDGYFGEKLSKLVDTDVYNKHVKLAEDLALLDYLDEDLSDDNKALWNFDAETYRYHVAEPCVDDDDDVVDDDDDDVVDDDDDVVDDDDDVVDDDDDDVVVDDDDDDVVDDDNDDVIDDASGKKEGKNFTVSGPSEITLGDDVTFTIKSDGDPEDSFEQYLGTDADGKSMNASATKGSTIITIKAVDLEKLGSGKHTFTFKFKNGSVSTTLMINEPAKDSEVTPPAEETATNTDASAQTGDSFDPALAAMIMLIALGGLAGSIIYKKKEDNR